MLREQAAELREFWNDVFSISPGKAANRMNIHLFSGEPFHTAGVTKAAVMTGQSAEPIAQERPCTAFRGETFVVVCFAVMNEGSDGGAFNTAMVEIAAHLDG